MRFLVTADTDIGISRKENQDSILVKYASFRKKDVLMAVLCDGMGGLAKGELASATVIRAFAKWFDENLEYELGAGDLQRIAEEWSMQLNRLNSQLLRYSKRTGIRMGTTFSGMFLYDNEYVIVHVGDGRIYHMDMTITQKTEDQTAAAREIRKGVMTWEEARRDPRRNVLLQCIGASQYVEPQVVFGTIKRASYLICSDGFWHESDEEEIFELMKPEVLVHKKAMHEKLLLMFDRVKKRGERDNISAILIKAEGDC